MKKYRVDNDTSIHCSPSGLGRNIEDTKVEWFLKLYTVNNDNTVDIKLAWILKKYRIKNDSNTELKVTLKQYQVDNDKSDDIVMSKLLFRSICSVVAVILEMRNHSACQVVANNNNY